MREHRVTVPVLALLAATRGLIGFGAGLLTAKRFGTDRRRSVGLGLMAAGLLSTIPLAVRIFRGDRLPA